MSTTNTAAAQSPLEMIAADKRTLLRTCELARELVTRHADLPLQKARLRYGNQILLHASTAEDVRAWAARLGAAASEHTEDPGYGPFQHTDVTTVIDGVQVHVWHCRVLSEAEAAAWRESGGRS
ncbi:hypothetical protein [Streptomyces sp. OE57]|uniref:hypothetical protein n=1 Tax=Streptomyces lacaronensis TaxID=3379885 RepID=UPI0039B72136